MAATACKNLDSVGLNISANASLLRHSSAVTQGTERMDPQLSSTRSRGLSSFLSTSTAAAPTALELATARGHWALFCFKVRNNPLLRALLILTVLLDCLGVSLDASNTATPLLVWASLILLLCGFICVVVTGAGSRGLWFARHAYLRSWSGWLDAILLLNVTADIIYRIGMATDWWTYSPVTLTMFAVLRHLRAWAVFRICRTFRAAISQLSRSANDLAAVILFVLVFSVLVLIVLLHFYGFSSWYRCYPDLPLPTEVQANDSCSSDSFFWDVDESQFRFCSANKSPCEKGTSCRNLFLHSVTSCPPEDRKRLQDRAWLELQNNEEAAFGVIGLQTLGSAAATLLQGFTMEGWALTMQRQVDGDQRSNGWVAYIAFPAMVVVGGMLLMNLAIAVLWEAFDSAKSEQSSRPAILRESEWRVYQLLGTDWIKYLLVQLSENWEPTKDVKPLSTPENEDSDEQAVGGPANGLKQKLRSRWYILRRAISKAAEMRFPELKSRLSFFYKELTNFAFRVAKHRLTSPLMLIVVAVDMVCLLVESGKGTGVGFTIVYIITTALFVAESIVLALAFGWRGVKDGFICLDIMTAVLGVVDGVLALSRCSNLSECRKALVDSDGVRGTIGIVLSLMRPFRIFKVVKYFSNLRMTAELIWVLHNSLMEYLLMIFFSCGMMAQLGLLLFFDPKYPSLHAQGVTLSVTKYFNFENPGNAMLLLLTILTGEGWDLFFKEFAQVYGEGLKEFAFDSNKLSGLVLKASFRLSAINTFLYFALLFLNCLMFNFYGAIMIGNFIRTQKSLTVKYAAKFIASCRNVGIEMPAEDALQGDNAQALYTRVDMTRDAQRNEHIKSILLGSDHGKSAKAFEDLARKTSLALDICKTVARKSSRMASRASSGSFSSTVSRHNSRSSSRSNSDVHSPSNMPHVKSLMEDTEFDRALAERGLRQPVNRGTDVDGVGDSFALMGYEASSLSGTTKAAEFGTSRATKASIASCSLDDIFPVKHLQLDTGTKAAVQFAASDHTVVLPAPRAGSRALPATIRETPNEELNFKELCSMFWSAIREALRQGSVAMTAVANAGLARICPADPDSLALQMAYVGHLVRDTYEMPNQHPPSLVRQSNSQQSHTPGLSSLLNLENKTGSSASITPGTHRVGHDKQARRRGCRLPTSMTAVIAKQRAFLEHLHNVCGITGIRWFQLFLQSASFIELVVECGMKKDTSSMEAFGYLELAFQIALTVDILLRFGFSFISKSSFFYTSCPNWLEWILQVLAWCSLVAPFSGSNGFLDNTMLESGGYRLSKCTRVLRCIWLLRLWKGTGTHRLLLALQVAGRRILDLVFILVLLITFFAVDFRYLLESAAGEHPDIPLPYANLTSFGESILSVFILTTSEGWPRLLTEFLDLRDRHRPITIVLCALVVSILSVFVLNLLVGIIVDVLDKEQTNLEYTGGVRSATVLRWNEVQRAIFSSSGAAGEAERRGHMTFGKSRGARDWLSHILTSKQLDIAVAIVSLGSCLSMMVAGAWAETDIGQSFPNFQMPIFWINAVIVVGYVIEQCLRIFVFRKSLFQKSIYVIDLAIAISSFIALIVALVKSFHTPFPAEPLWPVAFRMVRVIYVVCQHLPVMRIISITMVNVLGSLGRVLLLLAGIIIFYGLIGTCLFYDAPINPKLHSSFATLFDSVILLMSCCTGENWHDIMLQARKYYYERDSKGLGWLIVIYAVTFVIMSFLLLMNMFMSTVLKGYVDTKRNQSLWRVAKEHQDLVNKWRMREMKLSWLPVHVAVQVLTEIPPPIGFKNEYVEFGSRRMTAILASLAAYSLPVHNNSVHIRDVVLVTTCRACEAHAQHRETLEAVDPTQPQQKVELNPRLVSTWINRFEDIAGLNIEFNILHYLAALQIQAFWKTRKLLQRNNTHDKQMYMKHLLFLLETTAPICARKASRSESRRSTLRRKRGSKTSGSFTHKSTALSRLGTLTRSSKSLQQPKDRLKSVMKQMHRRPSPSRHDHDQKGLPADTGVERQSLLSEEDLDGQQQRDRQKSLRYSSAKECIIDLAESDPTEIPGPRSKPLEESFAQDHQAKKETVPEQGSTEEMSSSSEVINTGVPAMEPEAALAIAAAAAAAQLSAACSSTTTRFSVTAPSMVLYTADEPPLATSPNPQANPTAAARPRRSSMRAPQPSLASQAPRKSLRILPSAVLPKEQKTANADQTNGRGSVSDPPRRRGQSVQFTGVERLELQRLLASANETDEATDSSKAENDNT